MVAWSRRAAYAMLQSENESGDCCRVLQLHCVTLHDRQPESKTGNQTHKTRAVVCSVVSVW